MRANLQMPHEISSMLDRVIERLKDAGALH
jgi:hypothetical protein